MFIFSTPIWSKVSFRAMAASLVTAVVLLTCTITVQAPLSLPGAIVPSNVTLALPTATLPPSPLSSARCAGDSWVPFISRRSSDAPLWNQSKACSPRAQSSTRVRLPSRPTVNVISKPLALPKIEQQRRRKRRRRGGGLDVINVWLWFGVMLVSIELRLCNCPFAEQLELWVPDSDKLAGEGFFFPPTNRRPYFNLNANQIS